MAVAVLVALVVGATIALQAAIIGRLSGTVHPLTISLSLLVSGILAGGLWVIRQTAWTDVATVARQWWWLPLGAAGWLIVGALGWTSARLGVAQALAIVIGAQLSMGPGGRCRAGHGGDWSETDHRPCAHRGRNRSPTRRLSNTSTEPSVALHGGDADAFGGDADHKRPPLRSTFA